MASRTLGSTGEVACISRYKGLPEIRTPFIVIPSESSLVDGGSAMAAEEAVESVREREKGRGIAEMLRSLEMRFLEAIEKVE